MTIFYAKLQNPHLEINCYEITVFVLFYRIEPFLRDKNLVFRFPYSLPQRFYKLIINRRLKQFYLL